MARKLPPLNSLRAFESAARHLSFSDAAEELAVTQSAVSQQIKVLEDWLAIPLFSRRNRYLTLTDEGQLYLAELRVIFDKLNSATERVKANSPSGKLVISVLPSFAAKWLLPKLGFFRDQYPEIDVQFSATESLVDFAREDVDIAIRYGRGNYPGLKSQRFLMEMLYPVCSPKILSGNKPLSTPNDLKHHTLLHDFYAPDDWRLWLMAAGADEIDATKGSTFNHSNLLIDAAIHGQGVAMGRHILAHDDLEGGRLVKPFELSIPATYSYYVVYPPHKEKQCKVIAFRDWLLEISQHSAL